MKERLRRFMSAEVMNSTQLANELEIQSSGISHILSGRNKPSYDFVTKLLTKFPNLNPDWLLLGKGPMHRDEIRTKQNDHTIISHTETESTSPTERKEELDLFTPTSNQNSKIGENRVSSPVLDEKENILHKRDIERIIIFLSDGSFEEYTPTSKH